MLRRSRPSYRGMVRGVQIVASVSLLFWIFQRPTGGGASGYDWPQFDLNPQHSGNNTQETAITSGNVSSLRQLFTTSLPSTADGAPAALSGVNVAGTPRDLLYLTTRDGHILAIDAHSGASVWSHQNGPGTCTINNGSTACYTTSSPAIDPNRQYVYSYGLDGYVHKYAVDTGTEATGNGWPELATRKPVDEKGSAALSIATAASGTTYLYVANGGYPGDGGNYQGHVTTINLSTGAQHVFNTLCSNQVDVHFYEPPSSPSTPDCGSVQSAVWARAGVIYDPATDLIYFATGNGTYAPSQYNWGDSVLALRPDGTGSNGTPIDSYTPTNYSSLQSSDTDLGSTAPAVLPVPTSSSVQNLAVQSGKDGMLRLLNLSNLSGQGAGHTGGEVGAPIGVPQGGEVLTQPAVWVNPAGHSTWVFVANGSGISGLTLSIGTGGTPSLQTMWKLTSGGSSPIVAGGVLFYAAGSNLQALNPVNGAQLWKDTSIGGIHWESPIVANGILYITDQGAKLHAFALPTSPTSTPVKTATNTALPVSTNTPVPATNTPGPAPTNTPASVPTTEELATNGGFESGSTGWSLSSPWGTAFVTSVYHHGGTYSARFCGINNCADGFSQSLLIPSSYSSLNLSYWLYTASQDSPSVCNDRFTSSIRTGSGATIATPQATCNTNSYGWVHESYDIGSQLAAYRGQRLWLSFNAITNSTLPTTYYLDDVSMTAVSSGPPGPSPTDTPGPLPTNTPAAVASPTTGATATNTAVPPPASSDLVANGGFEAGQPPWQESSPFAYQLIAAGRAHTGSYAAWLCHNGYCSDAIWQNITVPSNSTSLRLSYWISEITQDTSATCGERLSIGLRTLSGTPIAAVQTVCNNSGLFAWTQESYDLTSVLSSYRGQTIQLFFQGASSSTLRTYFYVDDVTLNSS